MIMTIYIILNSVLYKKTKFDRLYTILQKNGGTDKKPMGKTETQFLSDPMSDRKKKVFANSVTSYSRCDNILSIDLGNLLPKVKWDIPI